MAERSWCERGDSNPHGLPHWHLKPARLPVPPLSRLSQALQYIVREIGGARARHERTAPLPRHRHEHARRIGRHHSPPLRRGNGRRAGVRSTRDMTQYTRCRIRLRLRMITPTEHGCAPACTQRLETSAQMCQSRSVNSLATATHRTGVAGRRRSTWAACAHHVPGCHPRWLLRESD